jgi:hypothetical protein
MAIKADKTVEEDDKKKKIPSDDGEKDTDTDTDEDESEDDADTDETEDESEENEETPEEKLARVQAKANKYQRLFMKARQHSKDTSSSEKQEPKKPADAAVDVDERILKSQGMENELLKQLKDVARLRGVGLIEAQSDPLFTGIKDQYEKDKKSKAASLGASKGSGTNKPKKDLSTPGLTKAEHKALTQAAMSS